MEEERIRLKGTPTKEDVEMLLTDLWCRAQSDIEMYREDEAKGEMTEERKSFMRSAFVTNTYILDGIAQWADALDLGINVDLEEWAVKNLV